MKTSDKGIHLMHMFEGYRDKPYKCSARIWTVGWGHALYGDQLRLPNARVGNYTGMIRDEYPIKDADNRVWSRAELVDLFKNDISSFERGVLRLAPNVSGRQGAFDACVAFSFNVGLGNFQRSTIRQKIGRKDWQGAADAFMDWTKAGGKVLKGLERRRGAERALFLSDKEENED